MFQQYHLYSMDMSGDELLDSQLVLVPNTLQSNSVSRNTFSTQLVRKLGIRGTDNHKAEAADLNNNNTVNDGRSDNGPSTSGIALLRGQVLKSINDNLLTPLRPILKSKVWALH